MFLHMMFPRLRPVSFLVLLFTGICAGCQTPSKSGMHVSQFTNFGVVEEGKLYRGDAPRSEQDIAYLVRTHHVRTIVDLRDGDGDSRQEKAWVDHFNSSSNDDKITWINLPCDAFHPASVLDQFRKLREMKELQGPVFVHCQYGRDRTGVFVAAYQISEMSRDSLDAANVMHDYGQNFLFVPGLFEFVRTLSRTNILSVSSLTSHPASDIRR